MAMFSPAVELTLKAEGGFFHNPATGEIVNHGITLTFVRDCGYCKTADEQYIRNLSTEQAVEIYQRYFWDRFRIAEVANQDLANKIFDLTVNMGPGNAAHEGALTLLQRAVKDCGGHCAVDGRLGSITIHQINALDPAELLIAYRRRAKARYEAIAANNPDLAVNLSGWLARLAS
jgi:lysozyme family protein